MIILDTNVIASLMRRDQLVVDWLDGQPSLSVWTTAISVHETRFGMGILATGRRRRRLENAFDRLIKEALDDRVLAFDTIAADAAGEIAARLRRSGRPIEIRDVQIAGIAVARKATIATRNVRYFQETGASIVDPWSA